MRAKIVTVLALILVPQLGRAQTVSAYLDESAAEKTRQDGIDSARAMRTAGIIMTSLAIGAAVATVISASVYAATPEPDPHATNDDPALGRRLNGVVIGITGAITAVTLPVGIPLWAVGDTKMRLLSQPTLSLATTVDARGVAGGAAKLSFQF